MSLKFGLNHTWSFEGDTNDSTGSNNLTNTGCVLTTDKDGTSDFAYQWADSTDKMVSGSTIDMTTDFSYSVWAQKNGTSGSGNPNLFATGASSSDRTQVFQNGTTGNIRWNAAGASTSFDRTTSFDPTDSSWNHYVITRSGNTYKMFINGVLIDETTTAVGTQSANNLIVGQPYNEPDSSAWNGKQSHIKFFDRALTQYEIYQLYYGYDTTFNQYGILNDGLDAFYQFSNDATDSSGNGNNLTLTGTNYTTDKNAVSNQALEFDGTTSDYATLSSYSSATTMSVSAWIKYDNATAVIVTKGGTGTPGTNVHFSLYVSGANKLVAEVGNGSSKNSVTSSATLSSGTWYHVVMRFNTDDVELFINGAFDNSATVTITPATSSATFYVGRWGTNSNSYNFDGTIDELRVYSRVITNTEILMLYYGYDTTESSFETLDQDNEALYHFTGDATDSSGNGNNLTNSGATLTTDKNAVSNQAYDFDGSSDEMTVDISTWYNTFDTENKSWSFWFNTDEDTNFQVLSCARDSDNNPQLELFATGISNSKDTQRMIIRGDSGTGPVISSTETINSGTWYLVVGTWDFSTDTVSFYLNGTLRDSSSSSLGTISQMSASEPFTLGGRNTAGTIDSRYDGKMDEVRLYNRTLTDDETIELAYGYDEPVMTEDTSGYSNKVNGVTPSKINGIVVANISKFNGV